MKYTNKYDLPRSIVEALTKETYDGPTNSQTTLSTTGLSVPPRIRQLLIRHRDIIEQDASDLLWILMGNAVHEVLGRVNKKNRIVEERLEVEFGDFKISGKPDLYDKLLQTVEDYKITCLPLEAQALTRNGWKYYNELQIGEEILVYDFKNDITLWSPLLKINKYFNAETVELKSKSFNIRCTWNHKWFVESISNYKNKRYIKKKIIKTQDFKCNQRIIVAARCEGKENIKITNIEAELLGWIITDGHIKNRLYTEIYQSKEPYRTEIRTKFKNWIRKETTKSKNYKNELSIFWLRTEKIRELYRKIGFENKSDLPRIVSNISHKARKVMLSAMMKAEGYNKYFCQKPGHVQNAFEILMTLEGERLGIAKINQGCYYTYNIGTRYVCTTSRQNSQPIFGKKRKESVWCPTTKYNSFVTKYKRQITITGNSVWATKEVKREWEEQINVNAWILRKHNYPIKGGFINAILRDWNRREAKRNPEYPQISFKRIPIKIWTLEQQEKFIKDRLELHHTQSKLPDNDLLLCTPEERWAKPEQFAVYKNKNKRATKLFDTEEDAKTFAAQLEEGSKDKTKVERRPGQDTRCMDYCLVNNFCSYYKEKYGGKDE